MNLRRITSLTSFFTFLITIGTSVILYIVPHGRVAYWADWRLAGLSKEQWAAIHTNVGLLFIIALLFHVYFNWKPMMTYMKNKARQMKVFTLEFNIALIITFVCVLGTYLMIPPFSSVLNIGESIKDRGTQKYGEPPYGHAELSSLKTFAKKMNLDLNKSMELLDQSGFGFESSEMTLKEGADLYGVPPQKLYEVIKSAEKVMDKAGEESAIMPDEPEPGSGRMTLADLCHRYNLNLKDVERKLKDQGLDVDVSKTIKEIGELNELNPTDVYMKIRESNR